MYEQLSIKVGEIVRVEFIDENLLEGQFIEAVVTGVYYRKDWLTIYFGIPSLILELKGNESIVIDDLSLDICPEYSKLTYRDSVADAHNSFDVKII